MGKVAMSPPWYDYANKIQALFSRDPDVTVRFEDSDLTLKLMVSKIEKCEALQKLLPEKVKFGNVEMKVIIIPSNKTMNKLDLFRTAFDGNDAVTQIQEEDGVFSNPIMYIAFRKEVIQYYSDNLGDINGNKSCLMEDIAREVFRDSNNGVVLFCTDNK